MLVDFLARFLTVIGLSVGHGPKGINRVQDPNKCEWSQHYLVSKKALIGKFSSKIFVHLHRRKISFGVSKQSYNRFLNSFSESFCEYNSSLIESNAVLDNIKFPHYILSWIFFEFFKVLCF